MREEAAQTASEITASPMFRLAKETSLFGSNGQLRAIA